MKQKAKLERSGWRGAKGQILPRDERGAGASGVASSRHCHMSPVSPFSWNLCTWSAYLGKGQSRVTSQQGLRHAAAERELLRSLALAAIISTALPSAQQRRELLRATAADAQPEPGLQASAGWARAAHGKGFGKHPTDDGRLLRSGDFFSPPSSLD